MLFDIIIADEDNENLVNIGKASTLNSIEYYNDKLYINYTRTVAGVEVSAEMRLSVEDLYGKQIIIKPFEK